LLAAFQRRRSYVVDDDNGGYGPWDD
jgi:hypothetical protein